MLNHELVDRTMDTNSSLKDIEYQWFKRFVNRMELQIIKKSGKLFFLMQQTIINELLFLRQGTKRIHFIIEQIAGFQTIVERIIYFFTLQFVVFQ